MRRFELVEGTSAKFWQIEVAGSSFTVAWGRLGTTGQSQVKSFADGPKAQAEADKLIREKTGKGYAEVAAAGAVSPPPAAVARAAKPDPAPARKPAPPVAEPIAAGEAEEDPGPAAWTPEAAEPIAAAVAEPVAAAEAGEDPEPVAWTPALRALVPARRGFGAPPPPADLKAVWSELRRARLKQGFKPAERIFLQQIGIAEPEAMLGSAEPPAPRAAAEDAVFLPLCPSPKTIDFLVLQGGLVHAYQALAAALGHGLWDRVVHYGNKSFSDLGYWLALRRHVAAAPPESYAALRALADGKRRSIEPWLAPRTLLLFPDEPWAEQELARLTALASLPRTIGLAGLLVDGAVADVAKWIAGRGEWYEWQGYGLAKGLLAKHGAAAASLIAQLFDLSHYIPDLHKEALGALGLLRTREAYGLLLERSQNRLVTPVAYAALHAFPRLGIEAAAEHVGRSPKEETPKLILRTLVAAHPALAAAALPRLSPAGAAALKPLLSDGKPQVLATPELWPEALRSPASGRSRLPAFWDASLVALPRLRSGESLPGPAVDRLGELLAGSSESAITEAVRQMREACEPASLDAFAWDLFEAWLAFGAPAKEQWAMLAMGLLGGDGCARRLAPLIREWPGEAAHARAVLGLDVLAAIGSDVALVLLQSIADKVKFKGLQDKAREKIAAVAEQRGLSAEDLADRLAPDLGLGEDGSLALDFGPRRFHVSFDEQLRPFVQDEQGKQLGDLPKPRAADDAELAAAAVERFKALKKDAKSLAGVQILRLERTMASGRRFGREVFESGFARHPLIRHLARRLVWAAHCGEETCYFRVAEDGTYTDREDAGWQLPESCEISVPHRLLLPDGVVEAFAQIFADYELLQPFPQLGREVFSLTEEEKKQDELKRFAGREVPTGRLLGLEKRGWRRGAAQDGGVIFFFERQLAGRFLYLTFHDGIYVGDLASTDEQTLDVVVLRRHRADWDPTKELAFGKLSPLEASEMLRDLGLLFG